MSEGFADRKYEADGTLSPRSIGAEAMNESDQEAAEQALKLAAGEPFHSRTGERIQVVVDTICLHGDGADAVGFARAIYQRLQSEKIELRHG